jgi:hypothetical protein
VSFRSQSNFRDQLIGALLARGKASNICLNRSISLVSQKATKTVPQLYKRVRMAKRGWCVIYKGLRLRDRPRKRIALAKLASNIGRESTKHQSIYRCKQCNVHLYRSNSCWRRFHIEK